MTRCLSPCAAACLALTLWITDAKCVEVALNYVDPAGVDLAVSLLRAPEAFAWVGDAVDAPFADDSAQLGSQPCKAASDQSLPCRLPDLTKGVLSALTRSGSGLTGNLTSLLGANDLVSDDTAPKTVLVEFDADGSLDHIDFAGVVRGRQEELVAPDAASVFVLRLARDGGLSVVKRARDSIVDPYAIRFSSEN